MPRGIDDKINDKITNFNYAVDLTEKKLLNFEIFKKIYLNSILLSYVVNFTRGEDQI